MLYYDADDQDGRRPTTAARPRRPRRPRTTCAGSTTRPTRRRRKPNARASGRSIGTIGVPRLIELVQKDHGKLAVEGPVRRRRSRSRPTASRSAAGWPRRSPSNAASLKRDAEATAYFFNADGTPKALGTVLKNPAYADDADAHRQRRRRRDLHRPDRAGHRRQDRRDHGGADGSRDHARQDDARRPGRLPGEDARRRSARPTAPTGSAACRRRRRAASPSRRRSASSRTSTSRLYKPTAIDLEGGKPTVLGVHLVTEAERLAYADRDKYVADTDFVPLPGGTWDTLLNKPYLRSRAGADQLHHQHGHGAAGQPRPGAARHRPARPRTAPTSSRSSTATATC